MNTLKRDMSGILHSLYWFPLSPEEFGPSLGPILIKIDFSLKVHYDLGQKRFDLNFIPTWWDTFGPVGQYPSVFEYFYISFELKRLLCKTLSLFRNIFAENLVKRILLTVKIS